MLGAEARRELEESESLPGPAIPVASAPKPSPEPEWKVELSRRLAGYRERQAERGAALDGESAVGVEGESSQAKLPFADTQERRPSPLPPPRHREQRASLPAIRITEPEESLDPPRVAEVVGKPRPASARVFDKYMQAQARMPSRPAPPPVEEMLAPLNARFIAGLLDLCVVALGLCVFVAVTHFTDPSILQGPSGLALVGGAFVTLLTLYWAAYLRLLGSTAGMHWTGLRVLNVDGEPPDAQQRWTRAFGTVLSAAAMGVGFLWSLLDEQHFTWHDRLSKTFVARDD